MATRRLKTKKAGLKKVADRPMPTDPKDLARAMFRHADMKMFGKNKSSKVSQKDSVYYFPSSNTAHSASRPVTTSKEK